MEIQDIHDLYGSRIELFGFDDFLDSTIKLLEFMIFMNLVQNSRLLHDFHDSRMEF